jgi:hypothetical protein
MMDKIEKYFAIKNLDYNRYYSFTPDNRWVVEIQNAKWYDSKGEAIAAINSKDFPKGTYKIIPFHKKNFLI